jgi:hypothetical protein
MVIGSLIALKKAVPPGVKQQRHATKHGPAGQATLMKEVGNGSIV